MGVHFNDAFSDDTALGMQVGGTARAMLLTHEKFQSFAPRRVADAQELSRRMMRLAYLSPEVLDHLVVRRVPPVISLHDLVAVAD